MSNGREKNFNTNINLYNQYPSGDIAKQNNEPKNIKMKGKSGSNNFMKYIKKNYHITHLKFV